LAGFIRKFVDCNVSNIEWPQTAKVKFGERIDQDEDPASWYEPVTDLVSEVQEIDWDVTFGYRTMDEITDRLDSSNHVYRACIELGSLKPEIRESLQRVNSPENNQDLVPESWFLEIEPTAVANLESELFYLGWMSINLWGYGYLYPWRFVDLVKRAERNEQLQRVTDLCRSYWPVTSAGPDERHISARRQMGELWPYDELDRHLDWYWGLKESG